MDRAPNNLQKILTHLSIKGGSRGASGDGDDVTYKDLDFEDFDDEEMEQVAGNQLFNKTIHVY